MKGKFDIALDFTDRNGDEAAESQQVCTDILEHIPELLLLADDAGLPLDQLEEKLLKLVQAARATYTYNLSEVERPTPEDDPEVPHDDGSVSTFDYGDIAGMGWGDFDWDEFVERHWPRRRGNPGFYHFTKEDICVGRRRPRSNVNTQPFVSLCHLVNLWWRHVLKTPFRPDFGALDSTEVGAKMLHLLNPAARLYVMIAQAQEPLVRTDKLRRTYAANYRYLQKKIAR